MLFQPLQRTESDDIFTIMYNASGAAVVAGYPVCWDNTTACDGNRFTKPATGNLSALRGIAVEAIASGAYGMIQVEGYYASANVINGTAADVAAGDILIPVNATWYLARSAAGDGKTGFITHVGTSHTSVTQTTLSSQAANEVLIRCL